MQQVKIMNTETLDKLFLEWSQFTKAKTARELRLERIINRMVAASKEPNVQAIAEDLDADQRELPTVWWEIESAPHDGRFILARGPGIPCIAVKWRVGSFIYYDSYGVILHVPEDELNEWRPL